MTFSIKLKFKGRLREVRSALSRRFLLLYYCTMYVFKNALFPRALVFGLSISESTCVWSCKYNLPIKRKCKQSNPSRNSEVQRLRVVPHALEFIFNVQERSGLGAVVAEASVLRVTSLRFSSGEYNKSTDPLAWQWRKDSLLRRYLLCADRAVKWL